MLTIHELCSGMDNDSDRGAHSTYHNNRSSTRVSALDNRTSPLISTATEFEEQATMTLTVPVWCIVVLMVRLWVTRVQEIYPY